MKSHTFVWAICVAAILLSSCMSLTPQEGIQKLENPPETAIENIAIEESAKEASLTYQSALISNAVRDISADESRVWIATDKGISMLDRATDKWQHYTKEDGLGADNVNAVSVDGHLVWFGTDNGVTRYDVTSGEWRTFKSKDGLKGEKVFCIAIDGNYVWFGTNGGLNRYDKNIDIHHINPSKTILFNRCFQFS